MDDDLEPWDWIPHVEGADRQKEINDCLRRLLDQIPSPKPVRWNPNTSRYEPYDYSDDQVATKP